MHLDNGLNGQGPWSIVILFHLHCMYVTSQKWLILIPSFSLFRQKVSELHIMKFECCDSSRKLMPRRTSTKFVY